MFKYSTDQSKQSQTPFLPLSTSSFTNESTSKLYSQIRIQVRALNGWIHWI